MKTISQKLFFLFTFNFFLFTSFAQTQPQLILPTAHTDEILESCFSPNSQYLISNTYNASKVWEVKTGKVFMNLVGTDASWSPNGELISIVKPNNTIEIIDSRSGKTIHVLSGHLEHIISTAWNPDGNLFYSASYDDQLFAWNIKSGKIEFKLTQSIQNLDKIICSPSGDEIISISRNGEYEYKEKSPLVMFWDAKTGIHINSFNNINHRINSISLTNDSKLAAISTNAEEFLDEEKGDFFIDSNAFGILIIDIKSGKLENILHGHKDEVSEIKWSPNNKMIASIDRYNKVLIWDVDRKEIIHKLEGNKCLEWSPDGTMLAISFNSDFKSGIKIYDVPSFNLVDEYSGQHDEINDISWSSGGKIISTSSNDKSIYLFNIKTQKESKILKGHSNAILSANWSNDGKSIVTTSKDFYWTTKNSVSYGEDDRSLNNKVKIWSLKDGAITKSLKGNCKFINSAKWSNDDMYIYTTTVDEEAIEAEIWDINNDKLLFSYNETVEFLHKGIWSPDFSKIVFQSDNGFYCAALETINLNITNIISPSFNGLGSNESQLKSYYIFGTFYKWAEKGDKILYYVNPEYGNQYPEKLYIINSDNWKIIDSIDWNYQEKFNNKVNEFLHFHDCDTFSSKVVLSINNDQIKIKNIRSEKEIALLIPIDSNDYFIKTPDNYYKTTKNAVKQISFKIEGKLYGFEQFDLKYNRPDIILDRLGYADSTLIAAYHQAYLKRLKKMNFTEDMLKDDFHLPEIKIKNFEQMPTITDSSSMGLNLQLNDSKYKLDRINIWVNDVAVYGSNGISLREKNIQNYSTRLSVDLAKGKNKVQVSVLNQAGAESYKETFEIECKTGKTKPDLYLITIGESQFKDTKYNLTYAAKDAHDVASQFSKSGIYEKVITKTLTNEQVTKENIQALKTFLAKAGINDEVMIFIAGHGVLDEKLDYFFASYDMDFNNPSQRGIAYEDLEGLLDGIKPLKKVLLIDACHSGEIDKEEVELLAMNEVEEGEVQFRAVGNTVKPKLGMQNASELTKALFTDLRKGTGATVISSAGGGEYAMESGEWKNGLFTYCLLKGIETKAADLNNDGEIWLKELQEYVQTQVTELSGGKQQPTSRIENSVLDYRVW